MKKLFISFLLLFVSSTMQAQIFSKKPAWSREFSGIRKKPLNKWDVYKGPYPTSNYYTDSIGNLFLKGGYLHIKATADKRGDKVCSSARISMHDYKSFLYGKIEVRAKAPTGKGLCPAIWMLREDHGTKWPIGEIDIMEYIECFKNSQFTSSIHLTYRENGYESEPVQYTHSFRKKATINRFHVYGLEWTPEKIVFTLDGKPYYSLTKEEAEFWPFDVPYVLILSLAYGGWGAECGMDDSIFPKEMLIDWIRYYPLVNYVPLQL